MSTSWVRRSVLSRISCTPAYPTKPMPPVPPSDRELDAYREQADRFIAELDEEFYLHDAGLKDTFDLTPIYERHANIQSSLTRAPPFTARPIDCTCSSSVRFACRSIGLAVNGGAR